MRRKDDLGKTVDTEDNLARMILIEQGIDVAYEIKDKISRSYAFCDCIIGIVEYAREVSEEDSLEKIPSLLEEIEDTGAYVRAQSYYAFALASFDHEDEAENILMNAIKKTTKIRDEFDRRDAVLDAAIAATDLSFLLEKSELVDIALNLAEQLTKGQKAYLYGYIASTLPEEEGASLLGTAIEIANSINDPTTKCKAYLELSTLSSTFNKKFEE